MSYRVGFDVGGTFTDLVCWEAGTGHFALGKVPTTPADIAAGILQALARTLPPGATVAEVAHGTTVATNALLERKGARVGLLTTAGFRDLLELRDGGRRRAFGWQGASPPLVPRAWRREVAERIKEARQFGDIAENAEYDDAKNEQAMLEKQISDLEEKLRNARVIDAKSVDTDVVSVGVTVHVKDQKTDKSTKFKIVGSAEADPSESKLSNESPVGRALLGHKRGETVSVQVPRGPARKLKITKIEVGL